MSRTGPCENAQTIHLEIIRFCLHDSLHGGLVLMPDAAITVSWKCYYPIGEIDVHDAL